ncbi:DUF1684 domain-containing protein [Lewinella sp. IMCC34191]|uniref:DUF1684 domain-containing protein n=1 Tax=Lewinella sp. IMCC34191 TaxID=2259172 RepID=UPI000E24AE03|nr:DUF1684 domain-containing protein [Lewinella sp. IMCC34191]
MHHSLRFVLCSCLLLFTPLSARSQADVESDSLGQLIDRLYTVEGFQQRFTQALDANPTFTEYAENPVFIEALMPHVKETALLRYGMAVREALADFTPAEIATLREAADSPAGPLLSRLLLADQTQVDRQLRQYVTELMNLGVAATVSGDSLLFHHEFGYDLRELMDGAYRQTTLPGSYTIVRREGALQTETVGKLSLAYDVKWLSNSQFRLSEREGNAISKAPERVANVYEIEGMEWRLIYLNPDGTYTKESLWKTDYPSYAQEMTTFRRALDEQYRHPGTSPLPEAEREAFAGHGFFPVDESFRIVADFVPDTTATQLTMPTSNESSVTYTIYGRARFDLGGGAQELLLLRNSNADDSATGRLFVPFRDATSGQSTYGGGRYLDISLPADGTVVLDFNKAYNPYCAYTVGYACPIPPAENTLDVEVPVGVKAPRY